jgi:hypothetical protein
VYSYPSSAVLYKQRYLSELIQNIKQLFRRIVDDIING